MMKVELAARNMPSCLIQVEGFVMRLWLYQDSGVHRLVLVYAISICNGIADIDFAEKDAPGTLLEHTKSVRHPLPSVSMTLRSIPFSELPGMMYSPRLFCMNCAGFLGSGETLRGSETKMGVSANTSTSM